MSVSGDLSAPLAVPIVPGATLAEADLYLGGNVCKTPPECVPLSEAPTPEKEEL